MRSLRIRPAPMPAAPHGHDDEESRVLVVDDVPEIGQIFRDLRLRIRTPRLHLVTEVNSQRAVELVQRERFDLVVSDFRMREVDGVEVLKAAFEHNPNGYRVLMTGYNEVPTSIERIREANIDAYIEKPLHGQELLLLLLGFLTHEEAHVRNHRAHAREIESMAIVMETDA